MSNLLTNQIRTSPGPSEIEKELIKRMEGQNFQNASGMISKEIQEKNFNLNRIKNHKKDNCQNLQQKLIDQKRAEIDRRNKFEEQSRKKKIQVSFGLQVKYIIFGSYGV